MREYNMMFRIFFLLLATIAFVHVGSVHVSQDLPPPPPPGALCQCTEIVVSSNGKAKTLHPKALDVFRLSSSHFNAFKSSIYRNSNSLALVGGKKQHWRIPGGISGEVAGNFSSKNVYPSCSKNHFTQFFC